MHRGRFPLLFIISFLLTVINVDCILVFQARFVAEGFRDPYKNGKYSRVGDALCCPSSVLGDLENGSNFDSYNVQAKDSKSDL